MANIYGTRDNDYLMGGDYDDQFMASDGNDTLDGRGGTNTVSYTDPPDYSFTGLYNIVADLSAGYVWKYGWQYASGQGRFGYQTSIDTVINIQNVLGEDGNDVLRGNGSNNRLYGLGGSDSLFGAGGDDWLDGGNEGDFLDGGTGNDSLWGGTGDDTLRGGDGWDYLDGGAGTDTVSYKVGPMALASGVIANLGTGIASKIIAGTNVSVAGTTARYIRIYHNDDYVAGPQGHELGLTGMKVYDAAGHDVASGIRSSIGGDGLQVYNLNTSTVALTDSIVGGYWNGQAGDAGTVAYVNTIYGWTKAYIELDLGSEQAIDSISLWGDAGWAIDSKNLRVYVSNTAFNTATTYASLAADPGVVRFDVAGVETSATTTCTDTLVGIENVEGSEKADTLTGNANANVLSGLGGNDTLVGSAGNDTMNGGDGIDTMSYDVGPTASGVNANLGTGTASKVFAGANVRMGGTAGRYIRIYHNANYVEGPQGHELGLTGLKVYDASGRELASSLRSSIGADGNANGAANPNNSNVALTDGMVGGGWNIQAGDAGNVAYANTGVGGAKAYIDLDLGSVQAMDSISLWGDAGWAIDSKNLRVYVSSTAFTASTTYASLAANPGVARFDLAGAEISAATPYIDMMGGTDTLLNIENLRGTRNSDRLTGDANANVLYGGAGKDTMDGGAGIDTVSYDGLTTGSVYVDLSRGTARKMQTNTSIMTAGTTARYIRIYHNANYVEGPQGYELGLTGMKVYDAAGHDMAFGLRSTIGADGNANGAANPNNSNVALTDGIVGGGWNGQAGDAGTVAYANTGHGGAKAYIDLDLGSVQAIDSISLWGDAGWTIDSKNLRVYVSNTAFNASTTYASLAADPGVARFDQAGAEIGAATSYIDTAVDVDTLSGIENVTGSTKNDTIKGDANANVLSGGAGSDTYWFQRGGGVDTIQENDTTLGNTDLLQFQGDAGWISSSQLWFRQTGNDLEISVIGTADKAVVQNWYLGTAYHVEQIQASDGRVLLDTQVQNLVQAMAAFAPPTMGQEVLTKEQQNVLAPVLAANWHLN